MTLKALHMEPSYEQLEFQIKHMNTTLLEKEAEVDVIKSMFLSNISHEIRTPMNAIVGFSNLLGDPSYNENQKQFFIEEINRNSKDLLRLIDNVLMSSKIQSQNIKANLSLCYPHKILDKLFKKCQSRLRNKNQKNIKLLFNSPTHIPHLQINTDQEKLELALTNLIDNAIKFSNGTAIEMGCEFSESEVNFYVKEAEKKNSTGKINPIIKNFCQENKTFDTDDPGLGIGLTLGDKIIGLLGGKLTVKSVPGVGSAFSFSLPLKSEKIIVG